MPYYLAIRVSQVLLISICLLAGGQAFAQCSGNLNARALFTQTNLDGIGGNEAVAYYRGTDGSLCEAGRYATGGSGSVAAIMNGGQNSVLIAGQCLLLTNGGPDSSLNLNGSVTSFRIKRQSLERIGQVSSLGQVPISVTVHGNTGYVVNQLNNSINGFNFNRGTCAISEKPNSFRQLRDPVVGATGNPAQVEFTPDGRFLVVTDRQYPGVGLFRYPIHVLAVDNNGFTGTDTITAADGISPFGFSFDDAGHLLVSNSGFPLPGFSSLTSYRVNDDGTLTVLGDGASISGESGACWVSYTTHTAIPTAYVMSLIDSVISSYRVNPDGSLALFEARAASASNPLLLYGLDTTLSRVTSEDTDQYLYGINTTPVGGGGIVGYRVERDGRLTQLGPVMSGPSQGFVGLAAR